MAQYTPLTIYKREQYLYAETRLKSGRKCPMPRNGRLMCSKLDTRSEALANDRGLQRSPVWQRLTACRHRKKAAQRNINQTAPRGRSPMLKIYWRLTLRDG